METFAVVVAPVAKPEESRAFCESVTSGERAEAHRQFLRRVGVRREHVYHQSSPGGDVAVLVWEGIEQERVGALMADYVQNPQSEHERYMATHVIPELHGVDLTAGPPPQTARVATIEA